MKRVISFAFLLIFLLSLCSCGIKDRTTFYYQRAEYAFHTRDGVIASEARDITGHAGELAYLISLYLMGPTQEELICPFPEGTKLLGAAVENSHILIELTVIDNSTTDPQYALACACLTLTCLEIQDAVDVTIVSGDRSITMARDNLSIVDTSITESTVGG